MKLKFLKAKQVDSSVKITAHYNGRMGFSSSAVELMGVGKGSYVKIAVDEDDKLNDSLFMVKVDKPDEETYRIIKAGDYFYINTKALLDELGIDYLNKKVMFYIQEIEIEKTKIYKLTKKVLDRKKKIK